MTNFFKFENKTNIKVPLSQSVLSLTTKTNLKNIEIHFNLNLKTHSGHYNFLFKANGEC